MANGDQPEPEQTRDDLTFEIDVYKAILALPGIIPVIHRENTDKLRACEARLDALDRRAREDDPEELRTRLRGLCARAVVVIQPYAHLVRNNIDILQWGL